MKAKYGLRAMTHLARIPEAFQQARAIALAADVPFKFLESIFLELRRAELLITRRGAEGGYRLSRPPQDITAGQIIRILDGMIAPIPCASQYKYEPCEDCANPDQCAIRHVMVDVRRATAQVLDSTTLRDLTLIPQQQETIHDNAYGH
jgi:Rrf2 family protein